VFGALIGAVYAALTVVLQPISSGQVQVRVAEALTILPFFSASSVLGLFVGCVVANIYVGNGMIDIVFGSLATLLAAIATYYIGRSTLKLNKYIAPLPPVIINAVVVGFILNYLYQLPLFISMLWVGLGQFIACYVLGLPLMFAIDKNEKLKNYLK
jgi:uncharacterized membrane protein